MSAGIKIHSAGSGALMIDGSYSNVALVEKVGLTTDKAMEVNSGYRYALYPFETSVKDAIVVLPLDTQSKAIYYGGYTTNSLKLSLATGWEVGQAMKGIDFFIFGKSSYVNTSGPALRIYSDITGEKVFDSRTKYLKIIGEVEYGMKVPKGAKWGFLARERMMIVTPIYTRPGSDQGFLMVYMETPTIVDDVITRKRITVHSVFYSSLSTAPVYPSPPKQYEFPKPLLVDLAGL